MTSKILPCLPLLLLATSIANASVIGWEVHNHTNHSVPFELWKHCMSSSPHDGVQTLAAGASYEYEELGSVNSGTCFFEPSFIMVRMYSSFKKTYISELGCFKDEREEQLDPRIKISTSRAEHCKLKVRFDING